MAKILIGLHPDKWALGLGDHTLGVGSLGIDRFPNLYRKPQNRSSLSRTCERPLS